MKSVQVFAFCALLTIIGSQHIDGDLGDADDGMYRPEPLSPSTPEPVYPDGVNTIPGDAGIHYPTYDSIVRTSFSCSGRDPGFYADIETRCQIWHICDVDSRMQSFLCTNGTIYNQATRVCEWWYNSNCEANDVRKNYEQNKDLYKEDAERGIGKSESRNPNSMPAAIQRPIQSQRTQQVLETAPRKHEKEERYNSNQREQQQEREKPIVLNVQHKFQVAQNPGPRNQVFRDQSSQREQQAHLPREVLEERRQAARDQFYSVPARTLQENRIKQNPAPREQRFQDAQPIASSPRQIPVQKQPPASREQRFQDTQPIASSPRQIPVQKQQPERREQRFQETQQQTTSVRPFPVESLSQNELPPKPKQNQNPSAQGPSPQVPKQKFRHSTPRRHNVHFAKSSVSFQESNDERQVPEETKQPGFPYYKNPQQFRNFGKEFSELQAQQNGYLPTPPSPKPKAIETPTTTTSKPIPKPAQNYRPPPLFPPVQNQSKSVPLTIPESQTRRIKVPNQLPQGTTKLLKNGRVVVKRRKIRKNNKNNAPKTNENIVSFPGNPHLESKVNQEFDKNHAPQKRCAVFGTGNSFKIIC